MIYDCFIFNGELDILDIRLAEMNEVVDVFVLVESTKTFQGNPKPLVFHENSQRFVKYKSKIVHVICEFPTPMPILYNAITTDWSREYYQRDQVAAGIVDAKPDDLIIVSDVDEIISSDALREAVKRRKPSELTVFSMPMFRYFLNRQLRGVTWAAGPRMVARRDFTTAQALRSCILSRSRKISQISPLIGGYLTRRRNAKKCGYDNPVGHVANSGWHFSSIGGWDEFKQKVDAYSHIETKDSDMYKSREKFIEHSLAETLTVGIDVLPRFVRENPARFAGCLYSNDGASDVSATELIHIRDATAR